MRTVPGEGKGERRRVTVTMGDTSREDGHLLMLSARIWSCARVAAGLAGAI